VIAVTRCCAAQTADFFSDMSFAFPDFLPCPFVAVLLSEKFFFAFIRFSLRVCSLGFAGSRAEMFLIGDGLGFGEGRVIGLVIVWSARGAP